MKHVLSAAAVFAAAALFIGCSGGGGSSPVPGSGGGGGGGTNGSQATIMFTVTVPASGPSQVTTAGRRKPQFQAPSGAQSVSFALNGSSGAPVVANLLQSAPGCTSGTSGLTCTVSVTAPAGADVFTATTYSQPNGQGTVLGAGNVTVTATAGQTTTAPTTLSATVASIALSVSADVPAGAVANVPVTIVAKDSNGNAIIGTYTSPITLTDADASNQTSLSATNVPDSTTAAAITLSYKGGAMSAPATIGASAGGVAASNIMGASFAPNQTYVTGGTTAFAESYISQGHALNGTPSPIYTSNATRTDAWTSDVSFNDVTHLVDDYETFAYGTATPGPGTNWYYQWSSQAPFALDFVGYLFTSGTGHTDVETCNAPYEQYYVPGAASWQPFAAMGTCTETNTVQGDFTDTTVYSPDGSYTDTDAFTSNGSPNTISSAIHSDGSAVIAFSSASGSFVEAIYTPAPNAATIPEYVVFSQATTAPTPGPANTSEPNWYATAGLPNGMPPAPLYTDDETQTASNVTLPSSCPVSTSILGSSPSFTKLEERLTRLDPTFAYTAGTNDAYLLNGVGVVCVVDTENVTSYLSDVYQATSTMTRYATQTTLRAAAARAGFANAMQAQGPMLVAAANAERTRQFTAMRRGAMLHRVQAIRQRLRSTTR